MAGNHTYVAEGDFGLQIVEFLSAGVEQAPNDEVRTANDVPTIVRGVLTLQAGSRQKAGGRAELLDVSGRKTIDLKPGANDVSRLAAGVYFISKRKKVNDETRTNKLVIQR